MTVNQRILKFDRTPVARLISCAAAVGSAALVFDYLSACWSDVEILPFLGLIAPLPRHVRGSSLKHETIVI